MKSNTGPDKYQVEVYNQENQAAYKWAHTLTVCHKIYQLWLCLTQAFAASVPLCPNRYTRYVQFINNLSRPKVRSHAQFSHPSLMYAAIALAIE